MFSLFARARAGAALAPAERMILRVLQVAAAAVVSFLVANAPAIQTAIAGGGVNVWQLAGNQLVVPLIMAVFLAVYKYFSAQADSGAPTAPGAAATNTPASVAAVSPAPGAVTATAPVIADAGGGVL